MFVLELYTQRKCLRDTNRSSSILRVTYKGSYKMGGSVHILTILLETSQSQTKVPFVKFRLASNFQQHPSP